ncbi:MAG: MarR family transcriptional regulator [Caulobacteraceae bacterium]|nr:MarR family transcriptional regulator [Caulobacteraceae bacterium]
MTARRPLEEVSDAGKYEPLRLDLQLCFALYAASNLFTRFYRPLLEPLGLTYPQYVVMLALWEASPRTVGGLGKRLRLDSGTLSPLLRRLEAAGLVDRTRDPSDERRVIVSLTPQGVALRDRALAAIQPLICDPAIPHPEAADLRADLHRLIEGLSERLTD